MVVYVVYCSMEDDEASRIIAEALGYELSYIPTEMADPFTQHTEDDIIAVGGWIPNLFYRHYFAPGCVDLEEYTRTGGFYDSVLNPTNYPDNPEKWRISPSWRFGVSPDGRRHIETITRENGTKVTAVAGIHKPDTLEAAIRFSKKKVNLAVGVAPWGIAAVVSGVVLRGVIP